MITRMFVPDKRRSDHADEIFGIHFSLAIEPTIFMFADRLSPDYHGGYWQFSVLSNGGFYMVPDDTAYTMISDNGFKGTLSAEAFGITVCLYAFSHLSFSGNGDLAEQCGRQFHLLRDFMLDHAEAGAIMAAID